MKSKDERKHIVRKFYDDFADDYDASRYSTEKQKIIDTAAKTVVLDLLGNIEGKSILDCGCGTGRFADIFARSGANAIGMDISENMLSIAKRKVPFAKFIRGDVFSLPFKEKKFDIVVCSQVLTHLHKYKEPLLEMKRVMKENGTIIIDIRNILWPLRPLQILKQKIMEYNEYNPHFTHIRRIKKICNEIGLEIDEFRGIGFRFLNNMNDAGEGKKIWRSFAPTLILKIIVKDTLRDN